MSLASSVAPATPRVGVLSHPWVRFGVRRLGRLLVSLWVLVTASFLMIHLIPGDPVRASLGPTAPASLVAARRASLGLDDPLVLQVVGEISADAFAAEAIVLAAADTIAAAAATKSDRDPV